MLTFRLLVFNKQRIVLTKAVNTQTFQWTTGVVGCAVLSLQRSQNSDRSSLRVWFSALFRFFFVFTFRFALRFLACEQLVV